MFGNRWQATTVEKLRVLRRSQFIRHNFVYFAGTMVFGALSYLYYPVLGRLMPPASFGEVQTLVTLFLQYTIFLNVLDLVVINILVSYKDARLALRVVLELEKLAILAGLVIAVAVLAGSSWLASFLRFTSPWPFVLIGIAGVLSVPFIFRSGYLQAKRRFGLVTGGNIVSAAGRLILGVLLVAIGWGTFGAIGGLAAAQAAALLFAVYFAKRHGFHESAQLRKVPDLSLLSPELKYAGLVLVGSLTVTLMYSVDIIFVKHYFDARTAGLYAGISVTARILFFLTASIAQVLIPSVSLKEPMTQNKQVLLRSLALLAGIGGAGLAVFCLAPNLIIRVLLGSTYLMYAGLLPKLSAAIFVVSIANLLVIYYTSLRQYIVALIAGAGSIITLGLMLMSHGTLDAVVNDLVVGSLSMLGMFLILTIIHFSRP